MTGRRRCWKKRRRNCAKPSARFEPCRRADLESLRKHIRKTRLVSQEWLTHIRGAASDGCAVLQLAKGGDPMSHGSARSEEHTSELQSLMRISYAVFCLKKTKQ